ncbi:MAG: hypothetical protein ACM3SV_02295, partial [Betaproteobacteria bacterium]
IQAALAVLPVFRRTMGLVAVERTSRQFVGRLAYYEVDETQPEAAKKAMLLIRINSYRTFALVCG